MNEICFVDFIVVIIVVVINVIVVIIYVIVIIISITLTITLTTIFFFIILVQSNLTSCSQVAPLVRDPLPVIPPSHAKLTTVPPYLVQNILI